MTLISNMLFFNTDARSHQTLFGNVPGGVITLSLWWGCAAHTLKTCTPFQTNMAKPYRNSYLFADQNCSKIICFDVVMPV